MNIFLINTPYHALLTKFIINLQSNGGEPIFIVIVAPQESKRPIEEILGKNHAPAFLAWPTRLPQRIATISKLNKTISTHLDRTEKIYCFNDLHPATLSISKISNAPIVLIEEGIGLYRENPRNLVSTPFRKLSHLIGYPLSSKSKMGHNKFVHEIVCFSPERLDQIQLSKKITTISREEFKEHLSKISFPFEYHEKSCLLIGQPLVDDGVLSKKQDAEITEELIHSLSRKYSRIYYKPHPRETRSHILTPAFLRRTSVHLLPAETPLELIRPKGFQPDVFTFFSSSINNSPYSSSKYRLNGCFKALAGIDTSGLIGCKAPTSLSEI